MTYVDAQLSYFLSNKFWRLKQATIDGRQYNFNESNSNAPTLQFSGGNIRGNGGCNAYHTRFTINGNAIDISQIMSTRMSCNDMYLGETDYFKALAQTHTLTYEEGASEFLLVNSNGDQLIYFAQFARSGGTYTPPPRREYREESEPRHYKSSRHHEKSEKKLSKKELKRQQLLEKKLNSRKGGKLTKKEKRELMALQSKSKKIERATKESKKGKKGKKEKRGGKKSKDKKEKKGKANKKDSKKNRKKDNSKDKKTKDKKKKK